MAERLDLVHRISRAANSSRARHNEKFPTKTHTHTHSTYQETTIKKNKGNRLSVILIKSFSKVLCLLPKPSDRINDLWASFDSNKFLVQALIKTRDYNL